MSEAFTDADYERVVRERDEALARVDSQRSQIAFYRTACTARFLPKGFGDETIRELINDLMEDRDDARSTIEDLNDEIARGREAIRIYRTETEAAKRERDLALGRLENEIKAAKQARMAEERARESLDELDAAIYDCLPSDYDDDSPLDCVEHAADRLRELARERDEARAEVEKLSESAKAAWEAECVMREQRGRYHAELKQERQEVERLRSQIEQLRGVLHIVSLDEYESTSSASEKVHAHARQARVVLNETLAGVTPSDAAHVASLENLFLKACNRAQKWETASKDAYRRGAEAMREACAAALMADGLVLSRERAANVVRALPIPEDK